MLIVSAGTVFADNGNGNGKGNDDHKITICHIPPGNPENAHTIEIGESAWPAHITHGDYKGKCQSPTAPVPELPTIALMPIGMLGLLFLSRRTN
jgi:hypothetical protein